MQAVNNMRTAWYTAEAAQSAVFTQEFNTAVCFPPQKQFSSSSAMSLQSETWDLRKQRESCQNVPVACGSRQVSNVGWYLPKASIQEFKFRNFLRQHQKQFNRFVLTEKGQ